MNHNTATITPALILSQENSSNPHHPFASPYKKSAIKRNRLNSKTKKHTRGNHQQYLQRSREMLKAIYINTSILFIFVNTLIYNLFTNQQSD